MLKSQAELKIIQQYASNSRLYTIQFFLISCIPIMLDIIVPMDESRPRSFIFIMEFFVDQDTYFYAILTYSFLVNYAGCITIVAVASILIAYVLHVCALFKITSYRIEQIFNKDMLQKDIKQRILYEKLICAIYIHRRATDLNNILTSSFATFYFILLGFGVAVMSFSLYHLLNATLDDPLEILTSSVFILGLYYIFLGNYVGQNVIDTSVEIHQIT
ncbi:uncharacterized protein LOC116845909 [Odontomachus brunneus]|uniref:uncharacterized protein LOC116845909 n=1 Tax=Odontomachus brunneus TaxID=486640 RepID=UPI0013F24CA0|nr:uncharacterized protein LOC116845909 [Odontomachus brunneus]